MRRPGDGVPVPGQREVFDSTGFGPEDHVALDVLLELAEEAGIGDRVQIAHLPGGGENSGARHLVRQDSRYRSTARMRRL
ncbi:hypothetical protein [Streptomyces sp. NPDC047725]|uniref:hypothetical protein n=1 Tax=Streptomyces sp. NPDC047725 TaxID=3365487 RepID=UPI00371422B3